MILIFVLKFEKKMAILLEGNEKNEYATKIWNEKIWKFSFLKFKMKFSFEILKNGHITREKWKKLKWRNHIFHLCHRDKTFNNTTIPQVEVVVVYH
jgi:hypothetical protein